MSTATGVEVCCAPGREKTAAGQCDVEGAVVSEQKLCHEEREWEAQACGGHSVVISKSEPIRNDNRIPAYGWMPERGYSVGYPFIDDSQKDYSVRLDFVCFSHEDANLIAAAPELLEAAKMILAASDADIPGSPGSPLEMLRDAIDKAEKKNYGCSKCKGRYISVESRDKHWEICDGK